MSVKAHLQVVHASFLISKVNDVMAKYTNKQEEIFVSPASSAPNYKEKMISAHSIITPTLRKKLKVTDDVTNEGSMLKLFIAADDVQSFFFEVVIWE